MSSAPPSIREIPEIDTSIDYTTPYDKRSEEFVDKRSAIIDRGVANPEDENTIALVDALKDCAGEMQHRLKHKISKQNEEIRRLQQLGNGEVIRLSEERVNEMKKEGLEMKEQAEREIEKLKNDVMVARRELEDEKKAGMMMRAQIACAAEREETINRLKEEAVANRASIESLKFALQITGGGSEGSTRPPRVGMFTLKPGSLAPYHGEKIAEKAYSWIKAAERVFTGRAIETMTTDSTERWGTYAISYLKGSAFEWAQLRWPLRSQEPPERREGPKKITYEVDWEEFKREFIQQHVPSDAIAVLQKRFQELGVTGTIREFNENFRLLRMRLRIATNEPAIESVPIGTENSQEVNRTMRAKAEAPLVTTYGLKLQKAGEVEYKKGNPNGPMSKVFLEYSKMIIENGRKTPAYLPTLEDVMIYMETMDNIINHRNMASGGVTTTMFSQSNNPVVSTVPTTTGQDDVMDWEASKLEAQNAQLFAMFEKALSKVTDNRPRCFCCKKSGHMEKDCWKKNGLPDWLKEKKKKESAGGSKKNVAARTTEVVVEEEPKN